MSYQNENFIQIENRNELIPEWKSFRYHVNGPLFGKSLSQRLRECLHTFYHFKGNEPILVTMTFVLNKPLFFIKQIQRNIWGWNELVLEWKSFRYHVNGPLFGKSLSQRLRECHHTFYHFKGNQPILVMMKFVLNKPLFFIPSTEELYLE